MAAVLLNINSYCLSSKVKLKESLYVGIYRIWRTTDQTFTKIAPQEVVHLWR